MLIHDNIRYLRKLKRLSQEEFAARLGLKRGNIASYENKTAPSLEVVLEIAKWYNISADALLTVNLSESLSMKKDQFDSKEIGKDDMVKRLNSVFKFTGKKAAEFAADIELTEKQLDNILDGRSELKLDTLISLAAAFSWLSMDWFVKGEGAMVGSTSAKLSKVAEPLASKYFTKGSVSLELFMEQVLERLDKLEKGK